jgi:hypothetical protein
MVGLIPLSTTVHELVGNNYVFVPTTHVFGKYKEFVERYDEFIDPELKAILARIEEATLAYDETRAHDLLQRHYIYLNIGDQQLPTYESIIQMMKDRIDDINASYRAKPEEKPTGLRKPFILVSDEELAKIELG